MPRYQVDIEVDIREIWSITTEAPSRGEAAGWLETAIGHLGYDRRVDVVMQNHEVEVSEPEGQRGPLRYVAKFAREVAATGPPLGEGWRAAMKARKRKALEPVLAGAKEVSEEASIPSRSYAVFIRWFSNGEAQYDVCRALTYSAAQARQLVLIRHQVFEDCAPVEFDVVSVREEAQPASWVYSTDELERDPALDLAK